MFTCVWQLCGWVDPTRMENKKGIFQSQHNNLPQNNEASKIETFVKHPHNQNSTDHGQRNVQYSLKQPNYLIQQINPNFHNLQYENQYKVYQTPENFKGINVAQSFHVQNYTQYEKNAQSQVHRTTHVPPQSSLANNIIVQNTPQIWVPQQPITIPYQPQPAQKPEYQKVSSPSTPQNQGKSNTDKKKAVGSSQLKSPSAKRPPEAPVTKQGWLHKQGSEGLMLWKKRWFVLVEYCLFYYKGPEEEKLLGSILLPSYKVSICKPEEKISKKYAFKCEHANMRTYILATDSQEQMMHWVTVMNLATLMQKNSELPKPSCGYNITYESGEQQYPKNSLNPPTPINTHSPSNSLLQDQCAYNQPLYANAPPKPRRLNDGFSSPSPDILDRQNVQYIEPRNLSRSPNSSYCKNLSYNSKHSRESLIEFQRIHDVERRTPETYGRSSNRPTDYEDIYAEETMYKRPLSPVAYNHVIKRNNPTAAYPPHRYTPVNMNGPAETMQYPVPQMRKNPSLNIARPHSADFLEYELNHKLEDCVNIQQRPRPKSSLEINSNDNDFYSRERYAEKMRKSVQYLKHVPPKYAPNEAPICTGYENVSPFVAAHSHFLNVNKSQMSHIQKPQPMRSKSALSEGKGVCGSSSETRYLEREMINPDFSKQYYGGGGGSRYRNQEFDQFTRSASARLAHQGERISVESRMINRDGERKREESMRRLLEWKQRMLQSPLNRKIQGNVACRGKTDIYNNNEMGYKISKHPKYNEAYIDDFHSKSSTQYNSYSSDDEASGSISINPRDSSQLSTFPRAISAQKAWIPSNLPMESVHSVTNLSRNCEKEFSSPNQRVYYSNQSSSHPNLTPARKENWPVNEKVSVSAGELLGRTHEELVLLLIQLRRQSSQTLQAIENCYNEFDMIQAQLYAMDQTRRMENLQKLEQIKQHLLELEKQYEKGKPLVNLVDNMVKLGSLYRVPQERTNISHHIIKDRIEFNQQIQERRLLADEKREWNRLNTTNHFQLQEKVQQLYMLDRLIHEESGTLQNLQQDKEDIERALGGLRHRLSKGFKDPSEIEIARKQQIMLENELIRVHFMLAQNSKKLEETVSGNAKLEQELMVLKQKLQSATLQTSSQYLSNPSGDSLTCTAGNSPELESDLHKVKKNIGELQQQRHKLSLQVRQLTDRSSNTSQTKCQPPNDNSMINKKRIQSLWRETDLDTMSITDHGEYDSNFSHRIKSTPLYINTNYRHEDYDFYQDNNSTGDNSVMSSNTPQEKQEIKTVRIVKRESEKRQRDREKCLPTGKWDAVQEENTSSDNCNIFKQPPPPPPPPPPSHIVHHSTPSLVSSSEDINGLVTNNSVSSPNLCDFEEKQEAHLCTISNGKSHDITPVFKSEAARQIITEMAIHQPPKQSNRRVVPKEKRRHYTAPHDQSILQSMQQLPTDIDSFDKHGVNSRRARDDLDMERALRQRIDAPDVVRSTLINTELKYNERTIDDLLGTPSKINIPERYIPEQLPQLSVEEQEYRLRKVESIKKMLSDTTFISTSSTNLNAEGQETDKTPTKVVNKATSIYDEKKQREHLLQLNQILAKQVMEMSKIVAEKATARLSNQKDQTSAEEDDLSPLTPLPLYQQRDNFYT